MRYLVVVIDGECPAQSTLTSTHYDREAAKQSAKALAGGLPGHTVAVYEWTTGYSSKTEVTVTQEWYPPPELVQELPPDADPGPAQNWTEDVENAALAKAERAGLTD
jgi:hypothetical protein